MTRGAILALLSAPALWLPGGAEAGCRLALMLGMDVSRSVDAADYAIQRDGLLAALEAPDVRAAFLSSDDRVMFAVYEWSGRDHQEMVVDWTEIAGEADIDRVAADFAAHERFGGSLPTAIGYALDFARRGFDGAGDCEQTVLDLSGDGRNNDGMTPADAYRWEDFGELRVNALAIGGHEADVVIYYQREVIRGPGAFVEVAKAHTDFPDTIRRKLVRELTGPVFGALRPVGDAG